MCVFFCCLILGSFAPFIINLFIPFLCRRVTEGNQQLLGSVCEKSDSSLASKRHSCRAHARQEYGALTRYNLVHPIRCPELKTLEIYILNRLFVSRTPKDC